MLMISTFSIKTKSSLYLSWLSCATALVLWVNGSIEPNKLSKRSFLMFRNLILVSKSEFVSLVTEIIKIKIGSLSRTLRTISTTSKHSLIKLKLREVMIPLKML